VFSQDDAIIVELKADNPGLFCQADAGIEGEKCYR
jgi:hypothetical protein